MSCNYLVTGSGKPISNSGQRSFGEGPSGEGAGRQSASNGSNDQGTKHDKTAMDGKYKNLSYNKENANAIYKRLKEKYGYDDHQIASAMGTFHKESNGFNTSIEGDKDIGGSYGLGQWNVKAGRFADLQKFAAANNSDWKSVDTQVDFFVHEMKTTYKTAGSMFSNATTVAESTSAMHNYERFQGWNTQAGQANRNDRLMRANTFYEAIQAGTFN